jgi:hypothetical protein
VTLDIAHVVVSWFDLGVYWTTIIPIHKKGDRNNPDNYRGIRFLNTGYKIYSKIVSAINSNCRHLTIRSAEWVQERQILHGLHIFSFTNN